MAPIKCTRCKKHWTDQELCVMCEFIHKDISTGSFVAIELFQQDVDSAIEGAMERVQKIKQRYSNSQG